MRKADLDAFLAAYPRRTDARWSEGPEGVVLAVEKASGALGRRLLDLVGAPPVARAVLDAVGSDAWRLADGTRTVADVARELVARHGAAAEPGGPRAVAFYAALRSRGLVQLAAEPWTVPAAPASPPEAAGFRTAACPRCGGATQVTGGVRVRFRCPHCGRVVRG